MIRFLLLLVLLPFFGVSQKTNMFIDAGAQWYSYRSRNFVAPVFATTFDYIVTPQLSVGGGLELSSFSAYNPNTLAYSSGLTFGLSPVVDGRYFITLPNGLLFPVVQAGYDLYKSTTAKNANDPTITTTGGFQYAIGLGYVFNIFKKDRGLTLTLKYLNRQFKQMSVTSSGSNASTFTVSGFAPTLGIKF